MFTDGLRALTLERIAQFDLRQFARFLTSARIGDAASRAALPLRDNPLNPARLVWLGIAAARHGGESFTGVLSLTLRLLRDCESFHDTQLAPLKTPARRKSKRSKPKRSKHDPRGHDPTAVTEEAFVNARKHLPLSFWTALIVVLTEAFETDYRDAIRFQGFRLLALDGTCIDLPHWKALAHHFGTAKNGRFAGPPQARMVMLQFPLVRIPWRYELTPLAEGERTVAARLLQGLQANDLVLMDQGFWSYGLFWQIQNQNAFFAIRLYPGVKPRTVQNLGPDDRLVSWTPSDPRWCRAGLPEAITLRVMPYQIKGFRPSAIVTNMLDPKKITRDQWIGMAVKHEAGQVLEGGLYHRRWEIETTFKELKVIQGMESGLRSRTREGIGYEIAGHVVLYLLTRWLMVEAAKTAEVSPLRLSFTEALRELKRTQPLLIISSMKHAAEVLLPRLLEAIANHRVLARPGRRYARPQETKILNKGKGKRRMPHKLAAAE
jgi:hypothetical protein